MKNLLLLTAATFALPTLGYAQTITESANAPATGVLISQPLSDSLNDQDDFTSTQFGVSAGQSFIPTENLSLSSVTVLGGGDSALSDGDHSDGPTGFNVFSFTLYSLSSTSSGTTATPITSFQERFIPTLNTDYLTFTLSAPVSLSAGTEYAYDISASNGFFGFATEQEGGYDGGNALLFDSSSNISSLSSDRTFYVEGNPVPEPSTWIMVGMGLLGLTMLRHRFHV